MQDSIMGGTWILIDQEDEHNLILRTLDGKGSIIVGLNDNGDPEDQERVKIFEHIKQAYLFLNRRKDAR